MYRNAGIPPSAVVCWCRDQWVLLNDQENDLLNDDLYMTHSQKSCLHSLGVGATPNIHASQWLTLTLLRQIFSFLLTDVGGMHHVRVEIQNNFIRYNTILWIESRTEKLNGHYSIHLYVSPSTSIFLVEQHENGCNQLKNLMNHINKTTENYDWPFRSHLPRNEDR